MFGFGSKEIQEALPVLRRIVDATIPNKPVADDTRVERRFNRSLACVLTPLMKSKPELAESLMAITQDISDRGLSLITMEELTYEEYVVSLWPTELEEPAHLRCILANSRRFAHGFWSTGFAIHQLMNQVNRRQMQELTIVARQALRPEETALASAP